MTKETKEERNKRLAEQVAAEQAAFRASLPGRIFQIKKEAERLRVSFTVDVDQDGTVLKFDDEDNSFFDDVVCYSSEEWQVAYVERKLKEISDEQEARTRRWGIAQDVWNHKLTKEEKVALVEFIHSLKGNP